MKIFEVWDHDPMDGSAGRDYIAARYLTRKEANADVRKRNAEWRAYFETNATDGKRRAAKEPWNWQHAFVVAGPVGGARDE